MNVRHFILCTAGHVDHGKSALVQALTGTNPDRLPEEKARGITIDLGFAHLRLAESSGPVLDVGIVDVPGHEDLIKNMVSGLGAIDLALLVVAADDGWMPQTEEHLQILEYLGVSRAVVALTKSDLVADAAALAATVDEIRTQLHGTGLAEAPIVPTSVVSGAGLPELRTSLHKLLAAAPPPADIGKPRLGIDRAFSLRGIGTVVTGTLQGGPLARGQPVVIQPGGFQTHIRSLQSYSHECDAAVPGSRVALNLPDLQIVERAPTPDVPGQVRRGQVVTVAGTGEASETWDVLVRRSARLAGTAASTHRPLRDSLRVWIHHGSDAQPARFLLLGARELGPAESSLAQLRFEKPAFAFQGDRFIVRDWAQQATLAGGIVLDPAAVRPGFYTQQRRTLLEARAAAPEDPALALLAQVAAEKVVLSTTLLRGARFSRTERDVACRRLEAEGKIVRHGDRVASVDYWNTVLQAAETMVADHHRAHPELVGLPVNQFRSSFAPRVILPEAVEDLLGDLAPRGIRQTGPYLQQASHRPALPPALQSAGAQLRRILTSKGIDPPSRKELAPDSVRQQALRFLVQSGQAVELSPEIVLGSEAYAQALAVVRKQLARGPATVSELRQALGASRRIVVPLLEKLDREGVTRRQGDQRTLPPEKLA